MNASPKDDRLRRIVLAALGKELRPHDAIPEDSVELVETGLLDSMAWVSLVRAVESAMGINDLGARLANRPASVASVVAALMEIQPELDQPSGYAFARHAVPVTAGVSLVGFGAVVGGRILASEDVDREYGMAVGKLRKRAGIESIARAEGNETEVTLGAKAAQEALEPPKRRGSSSLVTVPVLVVRVRARTRARTRARARRALTPGLTLFPTPLILPRVPGDVAQLGER